MKKLLGASLLIFLFYSCRKDAGYRSNNNPYIQSVLSHLRDSVPAVFFNQLDTGRVYMTDPGSGSQIILRVPFAGGSVAGDFVLLRTDRAGAILAGRVVHLTGQVGASPAGQASASVSPAAPASAAASSTVQAALPGQTVPLASGAASAAGAPYSGSIRLQSLSGGLLLQSPIVNGYITAFHSLAHSGTGRRAVELDGAKTVTVLPAPDADWLPEVVVVGYSGGSAPAPYIDLGGLLGSSSDVLAGGAPAGAGSGSSDGSGGSPGGGDGSSVGANPTTSAPYSPVDPAGQPGTWRSGVVVSVPIEVEQEYEYGIPMMDVRKLFNCFDLVPSEGAVYTIQLCVDLPVNSNPNASINFWEGVNVGHTFLVVTKSGSGVSITQSFGFYPSSSPSIWNPFSSIPSAIKDNGSKEINASINMSINSDQFNSIKLAAINLSAQQYLLDRFNCSDYALGVFNSCRIKPLTDDPYILRQAGIVLSNGMSSPSTTVTINNSPQNIFAKLSDMKGSGDPEASNIEIDLSHNLQSPISHGQCN